MTSNYLSILCKGLFCGLLIVCLLPACSEFGQAENEPEEELVEEENPNDWLYRQRAFPHGKILPESVLESKLYRQRLLQQSPSLRSGGAWELFGPTNTGGRISDLEISSKDLNTIYVGAASGGVFKSTDAGQNWRPIFDEALSLSIGDMALAPSDESVIYVGTGESNGGTGSLTYSGVGVYKSEDAGNSWQHVGLENVGTIGKVIVHPTDPQTVFVAAMGDLFGKTPHRGIYKSTDGGQNWTKSLYLSDSTGASDLVINPGNPNVLYAGMWERIKRPFNQQYGGATSGVYKSIDGGDSWSELSNGLPTRSSDKGRIGIAIAPSDPNILYLMYCDQAGGLNSIFKSTNAGLSWRNMGTSGITIRTYMYWFCRLFVSPDDPNEVYLMGLNAHKTSNGGQNWFEVFDNAHVDQHACAIHPQNTDLVWLGNDGGLYKSEDGGFSHEKINNLPITQFYGIEIDPSDPRRVFGGTQDNGTQRTISGSLDDWEHVYVGDGFNPMVDPEDNKYTYAAYQYGNFAKSTDRGNNFFPAISGINTADRKNWNTPVVFDPDNSTVLYYGSDRVYRSNDRAFEWRPISDDLTDGGGRGNLVYGTITSLDVSAADNQIIYAGTDDGNLWISKSRSLGWQSISTGLPKRWVTRVVAHPTEANTVYTTLSGYRYHSDIAHVFKSTNNGENWTSISGDLPDMPVNDLIVDVERNQLYIATDIGVFVSDNEGQNWSLLGRNLPNVVVNDLDFHPESKTLMAGTFGRSIYKYDLDQPVNTAEAFPAINMQISPNPTTSSCRIQFDWPHASAYQLALINAQGQRLQTIQAFAKSSKHFDEQINLSKEAAGLYFIQLQTEDGKQQVFKIVKAK